MKRPAMFSAALLALAAPIPALAATGDAPAKTTEKSAPVDPAALAIAHDILDVAYPPATRSQLFSGVMKSIMAQTRAAVASKEDEEDPEFKAIVDRQLDRVWAAMMKVMNKHLPDVLDGMAHAYARQFSLDDLRHIRAFVATPAGRHFVQRSSKVIADPDVVAANRRMFADLMARQPELNREMMKDIDAYLARQAAKKKRATHPS